MKWTPALIETTDKYVLMDGKPVPEPDLLKWARWFEIVDNRTLLRTTVGNYEVSTIFLGLDHGFRRGSKPVLWETMVFRTKPRRMHTEGDTTIIEADYADRMQRYTSEEAARRGHAAMVAGIESDKFEDVPEWTDPSEAA
jgi:hypothetical protein